MKIKQVILLLCSSHLISGAYAYIHNEPGYSPIVCHPGYWSNTPNCNNNDYNACINNSQSLLGQANNKRSELFQEQGAIPGKINICMGDLVSLTKSESDKRSDLIQSTTKVEDLKSTKSQLENLQAAQESFFLILEEEIKALGEALPEIAVRLNDFIVKQNTKVEFVINDLNVQLAATQDPDEVDKINLALEVFKKLKLAQSKFSIDDPQAFFNLIHNALYGEGEAKIKAIACFDPLTYLVLKTVLDNKLTSSVPSVGASQLTNQMQAIKSDMSNFILKQSSDLTLEEQKVIRFTSNYQEALSNRLNKESECKGLDERNSQLPQLIIQASQSIAESNALIAGCNRYCTKTWVPKYCDSY